MNKVFNFSAGPSVLPKEIINQVKKELYSWKNIGSSVMEVSHRSEKFIEMTEKSKKNLVELLNIPNTYEILFFHGGARAQFAAVPMNLLNKKEHFADYINSGYWSRCATKEAKKYCIPNVIDVITKEEKLISVQSMNNWPLSLNSSYIHYCPNETIDGIAIYEMPSFKNRIVVADFSSTILSQPINISNFSIIYASAQKNVGISGITLVIIKKDLLKKSNKKTPSILDYRITYKKNSMFNTPSTFSWYIAHLIFKWLKSKGGLKEIEKCNKEKAKILYKIIDESNFYYNFIAKKNRSRMNIVFKLPNNYLEKLFLEKANKIGLYGLKGHKIQGGIRASIYNAMPLEGVKLLANFMKDFVKEYG